jgi:acetylornithine deacetylase/succinyl-diaminopimelate desuccinylase-like protein
LAAHGSDADKPTVLIYGHYDVQPPDPLDLWDTPPFEPTVRDGHVFARGANDDKGQMMMHVKALESFLQSGEELPVNVKLLIEGEEEVGSKHLATLLQERKDELAADVVLVSDTAMFARGVPSITSGLRGLAYIEVEVEGPTRDLHSGVFGGGVHNPLNALCELVAGLHDSGGRITVEGFYDDVAPLTDEERAAGRALPHDDADWLRETGAPKAKTELGYSVYEATSMRPTLDLNGIGGGYQGEGAKTVLPARAKAKISCRLVPNQDPSDIAAKLIRHLETHAPETVRVTARELHGGSPYLADTRHPAMQAAREAMASVYDTEAHFTREGGSIPITADFKRILGLDTVLMGFGLASDALHSPNENFELDRFHKGIAASIGFMQRFGEKAAQG